MNQFPIPDAALDDRIGILGTSGSGKTYSALATVERLLNRKGRCVIIDPMGVCWGLRSMPDGKTPSPFNVAIFGGAHKDLPLPEHAGALIGETAATMAESCIIDLSELPTKSAERRFMVAFLDAIFRAAKAVREPFHLIIDEADLFAPQKPPSGDETLLGLMEQICRRGRVLGFIPWLISQRPAVLNKNVLSMMDGLVTFRMTSPQDRNALDAWIEGQADKEQGRIIKGTLPEKQTGHAVIWIPTRKILLQDALFPIRDTFDSSRAPKRGEKKVAAHLKPIDIAALEQRLSKIKTEADANDPAKLKARIRELEAQAKKAPGASPEQLAAARSDGFERGLKQGRQEQAREISRLRAAIKTAVSGLAPLAEPGDIPPARTMAISEVSMRAAPVQRAPVPTPARRARDGSGALSKAERLALTALAQYPEGRTKNQIAILTGYAVNGGAFNNSLSSLRTQGFITRGEPSRITADGLGALGEFDPLPSGQDLLRHWLGQLDKAPRLILEAVADAFPDGLTKESVAAATGYEAAGGAFNNALSRLRTLELIERGNPIRASEDLFG